MGLTVVDVKPRLQLSKPKVSFTLAWTNEVVERRSWRYEVWGEPPEAELGNLRSLEMPLSEDALAFARKLAASNHRYPDDRIAVADLL